ncbi:PDR/VanB family oxidoreductase [Cochlodiniinecator piscidefendens]|uniref:PDR/VanB family oxidoreductase n=1 Tax=Cochlodiniinecator piscidefendens TaxID=2715756 RepID=UPI00140E292B|nr:PDR/VanB family oxidoreductase [Cochlodiniinecator piscidefendens]
MSSMSYEVVATTSETKDVKRIELKPVVQIPMAWRAGAHVRVSLTGGGDRAYSLLRLPTLPKGHIVLGVLREKQSAGGSKFMHALKPGDKLKVSNPNNLFELADHAAPSILIAGGIGITPILSMAAELTQAGRPFEAHYAGRTEGVLAFVPEMTEICGDALSLHYDDQLNAMDIRAILSDAAEGAHVYFCGPAGMIEAIKSIAADLGWPNTRIHYELFAADVDHASDAAFDVEIYATGQVVHIPADKSIIEALEEAGLDPLYDCQRGDCGICQCDVIEGIPDHRDVILTDDERAANDVMQICVSRSKSPKLVIDI